MRVPTSHLRQSARTLAKHPGFAVVAILSLALAIAVNTTMYSMLDALMNPRIDMQYLDRMTSVSYWGDREHRVDVPTQNAMLRALGDFDAFTGMWDHQDRALIEAGSEFYNGTVVTVSPNYFDVFGIRPMMGRVFRSEDLSSSDRPVIVSERLARHIFPKVNNPIGRTVSIEGASFVIVGMLARSSDFPQSPVLAWTLPAPGTNTAKFPLRTVRRRADVSRDKLESDLKRLGDQYAVLTGQMRKDVRLATSTYQRSSFQAAGLHYAMMVAALAVLLVACANLANLQLARGIARSRELATRAALGASRRDLVLHLLTESGILAAGGLLVGLILTFWGMHALTATIPETINEYVVEPQTSWRLFVFAGFAAVVCVMLMGLLPAIRVSRVDLNDLIKSGSGTGSSRAARRQYGLLIATEVGFALLLVCGASVLVQASVQMHEQAVMYDNSKLTVATMQVTMPRWSFAVLGQEIVSRMRQIPDVDDANVSLMVPDTAGEISATDPGGKRHVIPARPWGYRVVTPSWARTAGFEIAHGRNFLEGEQGAVAIIDPQMARRLWPNTNAVGQMIKFGSPDSPGQWYTVVGVRKPVGMESQAALTSDVGNATVLATSAEDFGGGTKGWGSYQLTDNGTWSMAKTISVTVRARVNPQRIPLQVQHAFMNDRRFAHLWTARANADQLRQQANQNFVSALFAFFAALALALAALGVYGIVSYSVAERRREIGVRLALGSGSRGILRAVIREGNVYVLAGLALGLALVKWDASLLWHFLVYPEIDIYSVQLYAPAAALLFGTAVIAALIPALRATRIDPVESLRCE